MRNQTNVSPTLGAEIFGITAVDPPGTGTAARWIEPIDYPIESIDE
jgi:hypothetical protein